MADSPVPRPERPRKAPIRRGRRLTLTEVTLLALAALAALLALALGPFFSIGDYIHHISFEITIWRAAPDSMTYVETDGAGRVLFSYTTSKPDLVSHWYAYVNREPPLSTFGGCSGFAVEPPPVYRTYTFSARGALIERATSITGDTSCQYEYRLSAGSSHDPFLYFLSDPHDSPNPPPVGHQEVP